MSAQRQVIIFGAGAFAELIRCRLAELGVTVAAFAIDRTFAGSASSGQQPIVLSENVVSEFPPNKFDMVVAVGYRSMRKRAEVFERMISLGYSMPGVIFGRDGLSEKTEFGSNNIIFPGVTIDPFVKLGHNNIIWPGSVLCHDLVMGSHNYLSPGVVVAGNCNIGDRNFFGVRSAFIDGVEVASDCQILPGAILQSNATSLGKYAGIPAKKIGDIDPGTGIAILRSQVLCV